MTGDGLVDEAPSLRLDVTGPPAQPHVRVDGEIDVATAPVLRTELLALIDAGAQQITLDLGGVPFVDSSGLGVLVGALRRLRETRDGELRVDGVQVGVRKIFEITGLSPMFGLEPI
jgi:anti-sigma B factor antagonist